MQTIVKDEELLERSSIDPDVCGGKPRVVEENLSSADEAAEDS